MVDFKKYPYGKDQHYAPGIELDGEYHPNMELIIALAKALVKKGVITKQDIVNEIS